jgi:kynurenine formamidase
MSTGPEVTAKLQKWRALVQGSRNIGVVKVGTGVDLSTHPSSPRASFPYDSLPAYKILTTADILKILVHVPEVMETGGWCFILGVVGGILLAAGRQTRLRRGVVFTFVVFAVQWYLKTRGPKVRQVSTPSNVSGSPAGPCRVTESVLSLTNSHAGTHADTPYHFLPTPPVMDNAATTGRRIKSGKEAMDSLVQVPAGVKQYHPEVYSGNALVVDITEFLSDDPDRKISAEVLMEATELLGINWANAWRVLFCTRTPLDPAELRDPQLLKARQEWPSKGFAHFTDDGAKFLVEHGEKLLLVGIDTPSIDHSSASPICHHTHGAFCGADIAIVENLDFDYLPQLHPPFSPGTSPRTPPSDATGQGSSPLSNNSGGSESQLLAAQNQSCPGNRKVRGRVAISGVIQTFFSPMQEFADAKGCSVIFYPDEA